MGGVHSLAQGAKPPGRGPFSSRSSSDSSGPGSLGRLPENLAHAVASRHPSLFAEQMEVPLPVAGPVTHRLDLLPKDTLVSIFARLVPTDLFAISCVNKRLRAVVHLDDTWDQGCPTAMRPPGVWKGRLFDLVQQVRKSGIPISRTSSLSLVPEGTIRRGYFVMWTRPGSGGVVDLHRVTVDEQPYFTECNTSTAPGRIVLFVMCARALIVRSVFDTVPNGVYTFSWHVMFEELAHGTVFHGGDGRTCVRFKILMQGKDGQLVDCFLGSPFLKLSGNVARHDNWYRVDAVDVEVKDVAKVFLFAYQCSPVMKKMVAFARCEAVRVPDHVAPLMTRRDGPIKVNIVSCNETVCFEGREEALEVSYERDPRPHVPADLAFRGFMPEPVV